jgi:hypothetical protein
MLFNKFSPAFPDLADTVYSFLTAWKLFAVELIKLMAVSAPEDKINLGLIDLLIFSFLDPRHDYP